jgi:hypothetical protein
MIKSKPFLLPNHVFMVEVLCEKLKVANRLYYGNLPMCKNTFDVTFRSKYTDNAPYNNQIDTSKHLDTLSNKLDMFKLSSKSEKQDIFKYTANFSDPNLNISQSKNNSRIESANKPAYKAPRVLRIKSANKAPRGNLSSNEEIRSVFKFVDLNKRRIFNVNNRGIFTRESSEGNLNVISSR